MSSPTPGIEKTFPLDPGIASATIGITTTTDKDVLAALLDPSLPFPAREITLDAIHLSASTKPITLKAGPGTVGLQAAVGTGTGLGVFNTPAGALQSLQLDAPPELDLAIGGAAGDRYICGVFRYNASGSFTASQPVGAVGTLTFGASGGASGLFAVIHRFAPTAPADGVLAATFRSLRLPRHVTAAADLQPGTWVIGETDGNLALNVGASLGFDLNFCRKANLLNLTRDLSAKIDASLQATFGFSVSGRFLVAVGREDAGTKVHLQLFKQAQNGLTFGLNAQVGAQLNTPLPGSLDDFVKAVFGIDGQQVLQELREWTDPKTDLGEKAARLAMPELKELVQRVTGIDPEAELEKGHQKLMDALAVWNGLPARVSGFLWGIVGKIGPADAFRDSLSALADPSTTESELAKILGNPTFGNTPEGKFLESLAEDGVLALTDRLKDVSTAAQQALDVLNGGVVAKLQQWIDERLNLQKIVAATDPAQLDPWLRSRLADFLDKKLLDAPALKQAQTAVQAVLGRADKLLAAAQTAARNRYTAKFAATYQRTATGSALCDAVFDLAVPAAADLFRRIMESGSLDTLFTTAAAGVSVNQARLTHEIQRDATVQVHLPFFDDKFQHISDSVASLQFEHDAGRVLVYSVQAKDKVVKNRYLSQMQVFAKIGAGSISADSTISYQMLLAKKQMTRPELRYRATPFLAGLLPADTVEKFYSGFGLTADNLLHNGPDGLGDTLVNFQTAIPASILNGWIQPMTPEQVTAATMAMSKALQRRLRELIPLLYFQDIGHLVDNVSAAALLVWSALPVSTSIDYDFETKQIGRMDAGRDVYWNWPDDGLRAALASADETQASLATLLAAAQQRLRDAGDTDAAARFDPRHAGSFQEMAVSDVGQRLLSSLCQVESTLVRGAADALKGIQKAVAAAASDPSIAIEALADAGADLTAAFNRSLSVYGGDGSRALNSMLLVEASRALAAATAAPPEIKTMLNLIVLKEKSGYDLSKFLGGDTPPQAEIAVAQALVNG